jgi:hypothetical protein
MKGVELESMRGPSSLNAITAARNLFNTYIS